MGILPCGNKAGDDEQFDENRSTETNDIFDYRRRTRVKFDYEHGERIAETQRRSCRPFPAVPYTFYTADGLIKRAFRRFPSKYFTRISCKYVRFAIETIIYRARYRTITPLNNNYRPLMSVRRFVQPYAHTWLVIQGVPPRRFDGTFRRFSVDQRWTELERCASDVPADDNSRPFVVDCPRIIK